MFLTHDAPVLPPTTYPLANLVITERCNESPRRVGEACALAQPELLLHGHYHRLWSTTVDLGTKVMRVEGVASDVEANLSSLLILELSDLMVHSQLDLNTR